MIKKESSNVMRKIRHTRVRNKIAGTSEVPRLNVFRSNNNIFAQIIDDEASVTLVSASSIDKELNSFSSPFFLKYFSGFLIQDCLKGLKPFCLF